MVVEASKKEVQRSPNAKSGFKISPMKLSDLWKNQEFYSKVLTEHSRTLAFGVAAICWFFKSERITFPPAIFWALVFLVGFFVFDVLHYFWGAVRYRRFIYREETKLGDKVYEDDPEVRVTRKLDRPCM